MALDLANDLRGAQLRGRVDVRRRWLRERHRQRGQHGQQQKRCRKNLHDGEAPHGRNHSAKNFNMR
jgi:hypothetical protein